MHNSHCSKKYRLLWLQAGGQAVASQLGSASGIIQSPHAYTRVNNAHARVTCDSILAQAHACMMMMPGHPKDMYPANRMLAKLVQGRDAGHFSMHVRDDLHQWL
jgi:hypothetical protein